MVTWSDIDSGFYYWDTDYPIATNAATMNNFLENELFDDAEILEVDGNIAYIEFEGVEYKVNVYGNGDCFNHVAEFDNYSIL